MTGLGLSLRPTLGLECKLTLTLKLLLLRKCDRCGEERHLDYFPVWGMKTVCLDCIIAQNLKLRRNRKQGSEFVPR